MTPLRLALSVALLTMFAGCMGVGNTDTPNELEAQTDNPGLDPNAVEDPTQDDPDDPDGTDPNGDPNNGACLSDRVEAPSDGTCTCAWDDCDATTMSCSCDLDCYGAADCLVDVDADGNASSGDGLLGDCQLSCTPEDDLSTEMTCSASDCEIEPNRVTIQPDAPTAPPGDSFEAERDISAVDVVFVVDNSGSMADDQMAAACAMDAFIGAAGQNGGQFDAGVLNTDLSCDGRDNTCDPVYSPNGTLLGPPELGALAGSCTASVSCGSCGASVPPNDICEVGGGGDMHSSDDPATSGLLEQLIVQGDDGSHSEGGLEAAFQFFADQERNGTLDIAAPKEIVVISDENANADGFLCPFGAVNRDLGSIPYTPPTSVGNASCPQGGGRDARDPCCEDDLIDFYAAYFRSRNIVVHALIFDTTVCAGNSTEEPGRIYEEVANLTGGTVAPICECDSFDEFFADVGSSTSTLSTELCFPDSLPDPSTIRVVYLEGATEVEVPQSATDGWTLDANLNCLVMHGSWQDRFGTFRVEYVDPNAPPVSTGDPVACLDPGVDPIVDTIAVFCGGDEVPASATNGYTFDPVSDCFTFHGSYATVDGSTCTVEYL